MKKYLAERELWWPVSSEVMTSYNDGSHTKKHKDGSLEWRKNHKLHRDDDKPAYISANGMLAWHKNGVYHRDGDKPARIYANGGLKWLKNGVYHRGDMPVLIRADASLEWYKSGLPHRTTGPAAIYPNNKHQYWINGVDVTKEVTAWLKTRKYKYPFTPEQQVEFTLTFG